MATQTTNYGLKKPAYTDTADISVINENMDVIDAKMKEIENKAGSGGGGGSSVSYSTEEQVVGTWIDGKPLYQKTIKIPDIQKGMSSTALYAHNIENIENIFYVNALAIVLSSGFTYPVPFSWVNNSDIFTTYVNKTNVGVRNPRNDEGQVDFYMTIKYTKTTD